MEFSIKLDTVESVWSIIYIEGLGLNNHFLKCCVSVKTDRFFLENNVLTVSQSTHLGVSGP